MTTIISKEKLSAAPKLEEHPSVRAVMDRGAPRPPVALSHAELRALALAAGADDASAVSLEHPELVGERPSVLKALPGARTLVALVMRMHADDVRSPSRSVANLEFHRTGHAVDAVAHRLAVALSARGHRAINPSMAFPMEMEDFPGRTWVVAHKTVAVAAQLGRIGLHRSVIHPRFGSFILLGTVVTTAPLEGEAQALEYNPCVTCKLCVAACPVGAIEPDGTFRFSACYDHNYREFMTGFSDFAEQIADAKDGADYRARVPINESASMWQSLAYGPNYKAAHCIAVCPAGEDVLAPFLFDRAAHRKDVLQPLTEKSEPVYVVEGSDAQAYVAKRFPHKPVRVVRSSLGARDARGFFRALPLVFQRGPAKGWSGTFHFALTGPDAVEATVRIADGTLEVSAGLLGEADVRVDAPGRVWLDIVAKRRSPVVAVLTRKLKLRGDRSLLDRFAACFPR